MNKVNEKRRWPPPPLGWKQAFLEELKLSGRVVETSRKIPISLPSLYKHRKKDLDFQYAWDRALEHYQQGKQ